ncbi:outer membrane beta-barrel protein [Helicobacter pylori]|uniref:outer membrane beta-barrel protein n=1 Tax=Helicobacter pylori TaxID=210 RepID=UPI000FDF3F37|nr:outer membrane beta-barrel protein [Helicobacter pylori]RVY83430.1 outer membrane beta-barrel protein [Helicobacter pylori]
MKKSFKKLGFFSLATSSVLLGSMNATDLETYAALQKPSHVFSNYAEKDSGSTNGSGKDSGSAQGSNKGKSNSGSTATPQQQAQTTASSDSKEATTLENTANTDSTTATTDKAYESSKNSAVSSAAQKVETDNSAVQTAEQALKSAVEKVQADADVSAKDFDEKIFTADQQAEQTAESNLKKAEDKLNTDQGTLETDLQIQKLGEGLTKGIGYIKGLDAKLEEVDVSAMNTTLSGVTTISQQTSTISSLLSENVQNLNNLISNAQGLSDAFSTLASAQNTLKGYLDSSSATVGQLTNGSNAVVGALDKAINQVDMALADLSATDTQKTQAVTLATTGSSTTTDAINFLNALKNNLMAQKAAFMNVHKNIQTAVAQAQATYTPSVINTNNYGQMYGVDAMAGYKWFFGKTKRFGFRTYGYYSYNHANLSFVGSQLGIMEGASQVNNFTYGVGFDALYNFYESKEGYNTAGLFVGFGLGGDSFIVQGESYLKSQMQICNNTAGCSASMNTSYFQMPVQFGFRSNFSKHSGIEVGFKLPLFTNQFYKERGVDGSVDVFYKRNFSIYFNYMINF